MTSRIRKYVVVGTPIALGAIAAGLWWTCAARGARTEAASPASTSALGEIRPITAPQPIKEHPPQHYDLSVNPNLKAGMTLRPMDKEIFAAIDRNTEGRLKRTDLLDLFPGAPYHVKFVGSVVERWIVAVLVDLDRDGVWDEKWDLKPESVVRQEMVKGDPAAGTPWALRNGRWLPF